LPQEFENEALRRSARHEPIARHAGHAHDFVPLRIVIAICVPEFLNGTLVRNFRTMRSG
jgi:hypothetical protein